MTHYSDLADLKHDILMSGSLKRVIVDRMYEWEKEHGKKPTKIHISKSVELEMCMMPLRDLGDELLSTLLIHGPKHTFIFLFGLEPVWDATELDFE